MNPSPSSRLAYIDWLRGLACLLMFQTHCYDAWLGGAARNSKFFMWSRLGGTFPAPLFLFLAGVSVAIVADKLLYKKFSAGQIALAIIRRGAEILLLGILFRVQEFIIAWGWAPWSDLFRVDILNTIGVSLMLLGAICGLVLLLSGYIRSSRRPSMAEPDGRGGPPYASLVIVGVFVAGAISSFTPLLWTTWRPRFLPWEIETYIDGVHNLGKSQDWLFPIFPWAGFAFAGLALGFLLLSERAKKRGAFAFCIAGVCGAGLILLSRFLDSRTLRIYPLYDYWHTSPEFFMLRVGMLLLLVVAAYGWCRWGPGTWGFSPLIQFGQTSLLVYWVHIEFVYGKFTILPPRANGVLAASVGLAIISVSMLGLSLLRTRLRATLGKLEIWKSLRLRLTHSASAVPGK